MQKELSKNMDGEWVVKTSLNNEITAKCIVIAAGAGSFTPRKPPIENIKRI